LVKKIKRTKQVIEQEIAWHQTALDLARSLVASVGETSISKSLVKVKSAVPKLIARIERDVAKLRSAAEKTESLAVDEASATKAEKPVKAKQPVKAGKAEAEPTKTRKKVSRKAAKPAAGKA
jgi:uncharacterized protein (DUF305 family)